MSILITFLVGWTQVIGNIIIALKENNLPFNHVHSTSWNCPKEILRYITQEHSLELTCGTEKLLQLLKKQVTGSTITILGNFFKVTL